MPTTREDAVRFAMAEIQRSTDWQEVQHAMADDSRIRAWAVAEAGGEDGDLVSVSHSVISEAETRLGSKVPASFA